MSVIWGEFLGTHILPSLKKNIMSPISVGPNYKRASSKIFIPALQIVPVRMKCIAHAESFKRDRHFSHDRYLDLKIHFLSLENFQLLGGCECGAQGKLLLLP